MGWILWIISMLITFLLYRWVFAFVKKGEGDGFEVPLWLITWACIVLLIPYVNLIVTVVVIVLFLKEENYFDADVSEFVKKVFFLNDKE